MRLACRHARRSGPILAPAALALSLGLAACAAEEKTGRADYQGYITRWVGKPVAQVTADWGPPDYETTERGMRQLQYNYAEAISFGQRPKYLTCSTRFLVDDAGVVREATALGDSCYEKTSGPAGGGH
jgi:hypothetical protein